MQVCSGGRGRVAFLLRVFDLGFGQVTGYTQKDGMFEITYNDCDSDDTARMNFKELKKILVSEDDEEEETEEEAEEEAEEHMRRKMKQRQKGERKGPPRIAVIRDLQEDGIDVAAPGRVGGRGGVARASRRSARFGAIGEEGDGVKDMEEEDKFWVMCGQCQKWRHLPSELEKEVKAMDKWYCTMGKRIDVLAKRWCTRYSEGAGVA